MSVNFFINVNPPQVVAHPKMADTIQASSQNFTVKRKSLEFRMVTPETFQDKKLANTIKKICTVCGTDKTPEWRTGPEGTANLCNKCGLRFRKGEKKSVTAKKKMEISFLLNPV